MSVNADFSAVLQLAADLGKAGPIAAVKAARAVAKTAAMIESGAKQRAPVDTGTLRNSIDSTVSILTAEIGPTANYGAYVEYGTWKMAPQPYMGPSADAAEPGFRKAMEQVAEVGL